MPSSALSWLLHPNGELTTNAVLRYTQGDCWILAFELGRILDAPLIALVWPDDPLQWDHVVVDLGRETVLDVQGLASRDEILHRWSQPPHEVTLREIGRHHSFTDYLTELDGYRSNTIVYESDREAAQAVAHALIAIHLQKRGDHAHDHVHGRPARRGEVPMGTRSDR